MWQENHAMTLILSRTESSEVKVEFKVLMSLLQVKKNLNAWQTCHDLFQLSGVSVWLNNHDIFETFTLDSYRDSTVWNVMSTKLPPTPTNLEENSSIVKLLLKAKKTRTITIPKPHH